MGSEFSRNPHIKGIRNADSAKKMTQEFKTYSIREAAKMLRVGRRAVLRLIAEGKLRVCFVGKRRRISHQALREFIDSAYTYQNNKNTPDGKKEITPPNMLNQSLKNIIIGVKNGIHLQT